MRPPHEPTANLGEKGCALLLRSRARRGKMPILQLATAFHGFQHSDLVGVFDVASYRDSHSDARDLHSGRLELLREINRGGFAFDSGIGGEDHFIHAAGFDAGEEIRNAELIRTDAV